jgi:hypothetical protein
MTLFVILGMGRSGSTSIFSNIIATNRIAYWSNYSDLLANRNLVLHKYINSVCSRLPHGKRNTWKTKNDFSNLLPRPTEGFRTLTSIFGKKFPFSYGDALIPTTAQINSFNRVTQIRSFSDLIVAFGLKVTGPAKIGFWQALNKDIKIIYLKRNPYEQIASHLNTGFWNQGAGDRELWWKYDIPARYSTYLSNAAETGMPEILLAAQWRVINEFAKFEIENSKKPENIITIDYENYASDPTTCMADIYEFLNIPIENNSIELRKFNKSSKVRWIT